MHTSKPLLALALLAWGGMGFARDPLCTVAPFEGGSKPQGAVAKMVVANTAARCVIDLYGLPKEHLNPADSGEITTAPAHGTADFAAPQVRYTPAPGYVGADTFAFIANAENRSGRPLRLKVRVEVDVVP